MGYNNVFGFVRRRIKKELKGKVLIRDAIFNEQIGYSFDFIVFLDVESMFTERQKRIFVPLRTVRTMEIFPKEKFRAIERTVEYLNIIYKSVWKYSGEFFITIEIPEKGQTKEQVWEEIKSDFVIFCKKFEKIFNDRKTYFLL